MSKIELNNITKTYSTKSGPLLAVKDISFKVEEGNFVALVGPSGCGKSTLVRLLAGIITPSSGTISYEDDTYEKEVPPAARRNLGFVFQEHNLLPWYTVRENLTLPLDVFGLPEEDWSERINYLLELADLETQEDSYPAELSASMRQRLGVMRSLVHDPEILLMDEPFGTVDTTTREDLNIELLSIWRETNKTVIYITHNIEEAVLLASRVLVMGTNPGRITADMSIDLERPRDVDVITTGSFIDYVNQITGVIGELNLEIVE